MLVVRHYFNLVNQRQIMDFILSVKPLFLDSVDGHGKKKCLFSNAPAEPFAWSTGRAPCLQCLQLQHWSLMWQKKPYYLIAKQHWRTNIISVTTESYQHSCLRAHLSGLWCHPIHCTVLAWFWGRKRVTWCRKYIFHVTDLFLGFPGAVCAGPIPLGLASLSHLLWLISSWNNSSTLSMLTCGISTVQLDWLTPAPSLFAPQTSPLRFKTPILLATELFRCAQSVTMFYIAFSMQIHLYHNTSNNC